MPKLKSLDGRNHLLGHPVAPESPNAIGTWSWDATTDRICADFYSARLHGVDPDEAEAGLPLSVYLASVHRTDRPRIMAAFRENARDGKASGQEYRVGAADGVSRWVLTRGRFARDHLGQPVSGRGILVDITALRADAVTANQAGPETVESPLEAAAAAAIAAYRAIDALQDPELRASADALLYGIGRRLAAQEAADRRESLN